MNGLKSKFCKCTCSIVIYFLLFTLLLEKCLDAYEWIFFPSNLPNFLSISFLLRKKTKIKILNNAIDILKFNIKAATATLTVAIAYVASLIDEFIIELIHDYYKKMKLSHHYLFSNG